MSLIPSAKVWFLQNLDTFQIIKGSFAPQDLTKNVKPNWASHTALSRNNEILQFLNQSADTISFRIVMHDYDSITGSTEEDIQTIQSWARPEGSSFLGSGGQRPPILSFWVGQGWEMMDCVIDSLSDIRYGDPTILGTIRNVSATITLRQYKEFSLDAKSNFETRYHRAITRDYYELLAYREYRSPILGDVIRKQHPTKPNIQIGNVIRLPSVEAVRKNKIYTTSIVLGGAYSKKTTAQKTRRMEIFKARNKAYVSHIVIE